MSVTRSLAMEVPHEEIAAFCRKWGIRKLSFFGSVVRDDFGPDSDVDVLVEFHRDSTPGVRFFHTIPEELSRILGGRRVDLMTPDSLSRWIRPEVLAEAVDEYVETQ